MPGAQLILLSKRVFFFPKTILSFISSSGIPTMAVAFQWRQQQCESVPVAVLLSSCVIHEPKFDKEKIKNDKWNFLDPKSKKLSFTSSHFPPFYPYPLRHFLPLYLLISTNAPFFIFLLFPSLMIFCNIYCNISCNISFCNIFPLRVDCFPLEFVFYLISFINKKYHMINVTENVIEAVTDDPKYYFSFELPGRDIYIREVSFSSLYFIFLVILFLELLR